MRLQAILDEIHLIQRPRRRANRASRISRATRDLWRRAARAAGHALARFLRASDGSGERSVESRAKPHPAVAAIMNSQAVARLIGTPSLSPEADSASWLEIDLSGWHPLLRIHYRGAVIPGERVGTEEFSGQKGTRVRRCSKNTGVMRYYSIEALIEAAAAARKALLEAGVQITGLCEVRTKSGQGHNKGGVAMIALREVSRAPTRSR